jgi:pilus assembly protein CpaC
MKHDTCADGARANSRYKIVAMTALAISLSSAYAGAAANLVVTAKPAATATAAIPTTEVKPATASYALATGAEIAPALALTVGKSTLMHLPSAIDRISVGNPNVADVTLIGGRELYLLGKTVGSTNVMLWRRGGTTLIVDVAVNIDAARLQGRINELLPTEKDIKVSTAADSIVLTGEVTSADKADQAVVIAEAFVRNLNRGLMLPVVAGNTQAAPGSVQAVGEARSAVGAGGGTSAAASRVVNMLRISSPQQVMLEVKVAEVSKTLLDKLGAEFGMSRSDGSWTYSIISSLLGGSAGVLSAIKGPTKRLVIDAEKKDGLVKILAEPNIIAISGQEGSFLAGGRIFIPVPSGHGDITLAEREFGVGLKFTPTVLEGGRINLRVAPEVSELSTTGTTLSTAAGFTTVLPSFTTRRAQTTVQLNDGQSFAIAGLIKSNITETMKRFPLLGEIPVLGALFRSSEFQQDQTELMFIVTPRLVKPLAANYAVPGDTFVPPSRSEFFIDGKLESSNPPGNPAPAGTSGSTPAKPTPRALPAAPAKGGFEPQ